MKKKGVCTHDCSAYTIPVAQPISAATSPVTPAQTNDSERNPTSDVRKVDGLTAMDEAVGIIVDVAPEASQMSLVTNIDPYRTESVAAQCERFYKIDEYSLSESDPASPIEILTGLFPEDLLAQPFIADKFKDYMAMRADVEWYVRITSTEWNYGTILGFQIPFFDPNSSAWFARAGSLPAQSQNDGFEIPIETGISNKKLLQWCSPHRYTRIQSAGTGASIGTIGYVGLSVLNALEAAGGSAADPVTVTLYARFKNLELAGYSPDTSAARLALIKRDRSKLRRAHAFGQSKTSKEASSKSSVMTGVAEAASTITGIIGSITDAASVVGDVIGTLGPLASLIALNKPTSVNTPIPTYTNYANQLTNGHGIDIAAKMAINPEATITVDPRTVGSFDPQPVIKKVIQRPTLVKTFKFTSSSVPGTWETFVLNPINIPRVQTTNPVYPGGVWHPTYMAHFGQYFKSWHGGMNVLLTFHTAKAVSADFRICHFPEIPSFVAPLDTYDGDIVSEVINVHGNKEVPRFFADISTQHWRPIDKVNALTPAGGIGLFGITLESSIKTMGAAVDANIYVNMYIAAASDFDYQQMTSDAWEPYVDPLALSYVEPLTSSKTAPLRGEANLQDAFSKPFPGIRKAFLNPEVGIINSDQVVHVTDMVKRYCELNKRPVAGSTDGYYATPSVMIGLDPDAGTNMIARILSCFLFWRGSVRIGYLPRYLDSNTPWITPLDQNLDSSNRRNLYGAGVGYVTPRLDPIFLELPWFHQRMHLETVPSHTQNETGFNINSYNAGTVPANTAWHTRLVMSMGDDLSLGPLSSTAPIGIYTVADPLDELQLSEATRAKIKEQISKSSSKSIFDKMRPLSSKG